MPSLYRVRKGEPIRLRPVLGVRLEKGSAVVELDGADEALVVGEYKLCGGVATTLRTEERAQVLVEYLDEAANQNQGDVDYLRGKAEEESDLGPGDSGRLLQVLADSSATLEDGKLLESQLPDSVVTESKGALLYPGFHAVRRNLDSLIPVLGRVAANPVVSSPPTGFGSVQWPWIVNFPYESGNPGPGGHKYGIYVSSDHEPTKSGVGLYTAPDKAALLAGEWTDHGKVFIDGSGAIETETASAIWNPKTELWHLYYHTREYPGAVAGEVMCLATSPDGVTDWTEHGIVMDAPESFIGYPRPWRLGSGWFCYSLGVGGDSGSDLLWQSEDGINWAKDPRILGFESHLVPPDKRISWHSGQVFFWNGTLWWAGTEVTFTSGSEAGEKRFVVAPISPDFRKLLASPVQVWEDLDLSWEEEENIKPGSLLVDEDGGLVFVYKGALTKIGLAVGV